MIQKHQYIFVMPSHEVARFDAYRMLKDEKTEKRKKSKCYSEHSD